MVSYYDYWKSKWWFCLNILQIERSISYVEMKRENGILWNVFKSLNLLHSQKEKETPQCHDTLSCSEWNMIYDDGHLHTGLLVDFRNYLTWMIFQAIKKVEADCSNTAGSITQKWFNTVFCVSEAVRVFMTEFYTKMGRDSSNTLLK